MLNADRISLWRLYTVMTMDDATLKAILDLQQAYYMLWARWPTVGEIRQQLTGR